MGQDLTIKPVRCSVWLEDAAGHAFGIKLECDKPSDLANQLRALADKFTRRDDDSTSTGAGAQPASGSER